MLTLFALSSALAASPCEEILNLRTVGLPPEAVHEAVAASRPSPEDIACLEAAGVEEALLDRARAAMVAPLLPPPSPRSPEPLAPLPGPALPGPALPAPALPGPAVPVTTLPATLRPTAPGCAPAALVARLPDPGAAAALSGFVGYGAGSFYARSPLTGSMALAPQAAGSILLSAALLGMAGDPLSADPRLWIAGSALFAFGRAIDVPLATRAAHWRWEEAAEACAR